MRRLFIRIHFWLSLPVGLIISIVCLTGAVLSFQDEILELIYPERYYIEETKGLKPLSLEELVILANQQLRNNSVVSIQIPSDRERTYTLGLKEGGRISAFLNPYSGEITGLFSYSESFFFKIMALHRWLMDGSRTVGKVTVGISTIFFILILITGIFIWIPANKRRWRHSFRVYISMGIIRFLRDIHTTLGMYAFLLLLMCSLTGLMWSFEGYRTSIFSLFGVDVSQTTHRGGHGGEGNHQAQDHNVNFAQWDKVFTQLAEGNPEYKYIRIQDKSATVLAAEVDHNRATDRYEFNEHTGEIVSSSFYRETKSSSKVMTWAYALHVGTYWGFYGKLITCIASLIGASLPITGYYMYFVRKRAAYRYQKQLKAV